MIRPRIGNFVYDGAEVETMRQDIIAFTDEEGVAGLVIGCLLSNGTIDVVTLER